MITFELTPMMRSLITGCGYTPETRFEMLSTGDTRVTGDETSAKYLIHVFTNIVNGTASHMKQNRKHTSALAAIKRIRKALGLKSADFAKNPNLRGR